MRFAIAILVGAACLWAAPALADPVSKQNGSTPVFKDFTSICAVAGYLNYGLCGGSSATFKNVSGRINAIQAKPGRWNLGVSFTGLTPGATYRLWGNQDGATPVAGVISGFFIVGTGVAATDGTLRFSYQTTNPVNLGFDLNILVEPYLYNGYTLVTSYWSQQAIEVLNPDGTLYVPGS